MAVSFTSADAKTYQFSADTEAKIRFYLIDNGTSQSLVKDRLRYIWQTKDSEEGAAIIPPDTAQISVFNGSSNVAIDGLLISSSAIDTLVEMGGLSFGSKSSYVKLPAASATNFNVSVIIDGDSTLTSFTVAAQPQSRYTATIFGAGSTVGHSVLTDD